MQLTIEVPDSIGKVITHSPESQALVVEALRGIAEQLQEEERIAQKETKPSSKWAKLVEKNKQDPIRLGGYTDQDKKDRAEFKENFEFHHDQ